MNDRDERDSLFYKTRVDWASNPQLAMETDVLSIPNLTRKQRLDLYEQRERITKRKPETGFQNFNQYYAQAYGQMPSEDDITNNTQTARHYYRQANSFYDDIEKIKSNGEDIVISDDEYNTLAKGSLTKTAITDATTGNGYTNINEDMRKYLSQGLAQQNIPVTDETLQKLYRFYMARTLSNG
jgi:hypothetical protein